MTKAEIRKQKLKERKNVTERDKKDKKIISRLIQQDFYEKAKTIMTYISYNGEVDTKELIKKMLLDKKTLCAPKCVTECDIKAMSFCDFSELSVGAYGILEPSGKEITDIDLIIVPGVAFSERLHRIGYGAGYYDRFLEKNSAVTVGLFYEMQKADFKEDTKDLALDYIITEENIYKKG